jgi:hypothetical protein
MYEGGPAHLFCAYAQLRPVQVEAPQQPLRWVGVDLKRRPWGT